MHNTDHHHRKFDIDEDGLKKNGHEHVHEHVNDYNQAVAAHRKTFPSKQMVIEQTPDPAVREMLLHMQEMGCETTFDRFDAQKPHCAFGMAGVCCKTCTMGPCKITKKSPRGACGADADLIVARNMLRHMGGAIAGHGGRGRESMLALKLAAEARIDLPIEGAGKVLATAKTFGLETEGKTTSELANEVADILLEDLSRTVPGKHKTIQAFASPERIKVWEDLDIMPISAYHELFEAMHRTGTGTDGDWRNIMKQFDRCGLAFCWSSVLGSAIATDSLFGLPVRSQTKVNLGALKKGYVNIAIHGHSPLLVQAIVKLGNSQVCQDLAKDQGALGIQFYGICCSGLSAMYRYGGVIPLSNAAGAELVLGTGALDLWVADVQDVFPGIMSVAKCVKTTVVTTNDATRLPDAEHYGFDHHHSNIDETDALARRILERAIESFSERRDVPVFIPQYEVEAEIGFSAENITSYYGGDLTPLVEALKSGKIRGIVNLVGCNNPRIIYEKAIAEVADILLENDILILTNGCASFPLLKLGFCNPRAASKAGAGLREFLGEELPPVWHMGECIDNSRASALFKGIAGGSGLPLAGLPFAFVSPEWSNEKGIGAALSFRLLGINSYHCVYPPIQGSDNVMEYVLNGGKDTLGSRMIVNTDHVALAHEIVADMDALRKILGWD
jgi:carbon-monoxide dehydrogenase catalytic subunit